MKLHSSATACLSFDKSLNGDFSVGIAGKRRFATLSKADVRDIRRGI
jgi:hypothetical protein